MYSNNLVNVYIREIYKPNIYNTNIYTNIYDVLVLIYVHHIYICTNICNKKSWICSTYDLLLLNPKHLLFLHPLPQWEGPAVIAAKWDSNMMLSFGTRHNSVSGQSWNDRSKTTEPTSWDNTSSQRSGHKNEQINLTVGNWR